MKRLSSYENLIFGKDIAKVPMSLQDKELQSFADEKSVTLRLRSA
jgi:hypothetical protein